MLAAIRSSVKIQGVLCVVLGMVALSFQDSLIKKMSGDYPLHEIILGRACTAILLIAFFAHLEGGLALLRTRRLAPHLARGVLLVVSNVCYFLALAALPLAEAAGIFFVAPLFITMLSVPFLGERVGPWRWAAVFMGLAGVAVMLRPGDGILEIVCRETTVGRAVWRSERLLQKPEEGDTQEGFFVDEFVKDRSSRSLAHVFTLLSLFLPAEPLRIAFKGLHTSDAKLKGTALEYLEGVLPPAIRELLWPFLEDSRPPGHSERPREEVLDELLRSNQSIAINIEEIRRRSRKP